MTRQKNNQPTNQPTDRKAREETHSTEAPLCFERLHTTPIVIFPATWKLLQLNFECNINSNLNNAKLVLAIQPWRAGRHILLLGDFHLTYILCTYVYVMYCETVDYIVRCYYTITLVKNVCLSKVNTKCYRVLIKYCVFSLKFCDYSELYQFCCSAGVLPAWCVYTHWNRGKTESKKVGKNTIFNEHPVITFL